MERGAKPILVQKFAVGSGQCADRRGVRRSDHEGHTSARDHRKFKEGGNEE